MGATDTDTLRQALIDRTVEWAALLGDAFVDAARAGCSRRTGALWDSIQRDEPQVAGDQVTVRVSAGEGLEYARYVDEGTGVFIGEGPIHALHNLANGQPGYMVFDSPIMGIVFTREIQGMPGTHFWQNAIDQWPSIVGGVG